MAAESYAKSSFGMLKDIKIQICASQGFRSCFFFLFMLTHNLLASKFLKFSRKTPLNRRFFFRGFKFEPAKNKLKIGLLKTHTNCLKADSKIKRE